MVKFNEISQTVLAITILKISNIWLVPYSKMHGTMDHITLTSRIFFLLYQRTC